MKEMKRQNLQNPEPAPSLQPSLDPHRPSQGCGHRKEAANPRHTPHHPQTHQHTDTRYFAPGVKASGMEHHAEECLWDSRGMLWGCTGRRLLLEVMRLWIPPSEREAAL